MGHHPPTTGFTWPVPPEDLEGEPVLFLEWNADGRVTVRQEAGAAPVPEDWALDAALLLQEPASSPIQTTNALPVPLELPLAITGRPPVTRDRTLALQFAHETEGSAWNPLVRERATWLGIGTLLGVMLAASTLPEPPPIELERTTPTAPNVRVADAPRPAVASLAVNRATPDSTLTPPQTPPAFAPVRPAAAAPITKAPATKAPAPRATPRPVPASVSVSRPPAVAHPKPSSPPATAPAAADTSAVLQQVHRYEAAVTRLDASAAHALWPATDRAALVKQFTALREQRLRLERCSVAVPDLRATVTCRGTLTYRPRVGDHSTRTTRGTWQFVLERDGERWVIDDVTAPTAASSPTGG